MSESASPSFAGSSAGAVDGPRVGDVAILVALGLALRVWLIVRYPIVFGGDTVLRLANPEYIVLSYQLPLPQACVHYLYLLAPSPALVRYFFSFVGAIAGAGFYLLSTGFVPRTEAFWAAVLFTCNPFILPLSTVPYQEIFMVAGLLVAFYGAFAGRALVASAGLGVACLSRYESWLACPVIAADYLRRKGLSTRSVASAVVLFGLVPIAWIIYSRGITPAGGYAVEGQVSWARLIRWLYLGYLTARNLPVPALALVGLGAWRFVREQRWREPQYRALLAFLALFLIAILFSAHGVAPDPERRVVSREAHIPLVAASLLAGLGLTALRRYRVPVAAACAVLGVWMSDRYVAAATSAPDLVVSFKTAQVLDSLVGPGQHVVVLASPIPGVEDYLDKLERIRGPHALAAGIKILNTLETTPPDFQRILVHSRLGKRRLHSYSSLIRRTAAGADTVVTRPPLAKVPEWVVKWNAFRATSDAESQLAEQVRSLAPTRIIRQGDSWVAIYRTDSVSKR